MALTIYHNPRCSKSRQTLALIKAAGVDVNIVHYLDTPLNAAQIKELITKLGFKTARDLMRKGETAYKEADIKDVRDENALIFAMVSNPKLIERPIVVNGEVAILGRPPENITKIL